MGRESLIPACLMHTGLIILFSDPLAVSLTLHKGVAKHIFKGCGVNTADFFVVNSEEDINDIELDFPLFAKPIAEGTGKGVSSKSVVWDMHELRTVCTELLATYRQPVLVEKTSYGQRIYSRDYGVCLLSRIYRCHGNNTESERRYLCVFL